VFRCPALPYVVGRLGARRSVRSPCIERVLTHGCRVRPGPSSPRCVMRLWGSKRVYVCPCGLPFRSRVTEVRGYQKTFSVSSRVDRTTMPFSDTSSSVPACHCPGPKYTITSCPSQASGIWSATDPPSSASFLMRASYPWSGASRSLSEGGAAKNP
jgi:hypothetical protein